MRTLLLTTAAFAALSTCAVAETTVDEVIITATRLPTKPDVVTGARVIDRAEIEGLTFDGADRANNCLALRIRDGRPVDIDVRGCGFTRAWGSLVDVSSVVDAPTKAGASNLLVPSVIARNFARGSPE